MGKFTPDRQLDPTTGTGEGINDEVNANCEEWKTEVSVTLHDWEFPDVPVMHQNDFIRAAEIKLMLERFKSEVLTKLEKF